MKRLAILMVLCLAFTGCKPNTTPPGEVPKPTQPLETPVEGGSISLSMRTPDSLHPIFTKQESNIKIYNLIYDGLIYVDSEMRPVPYLAESCTISSDKATINFTLKSGVHWHDGVAFTSADVAHTFDLIKNAGEESIYTERLEKVERVTILDDLRFNIKLTEPYVNILNLLDFPIVPAHRADLETTPVGTGQFKFVEFQPKKIMKLVKNDNWSQGKPPYIDTLDVKIVDNTDDVVSVLRIGEISAATSDISGLGGFGIGGNIKAVEYPTLKYEFVGFNHLNPGLSSNKVRQAISHGIDRDLVIDEFYFGFATDVNSPVPSESWLYSRETDIRDFNVEKSRALLFEEGFVDNNGDGYLEKTLDDGNIISLHFSLLVNEDNPSRVKCAKWLVSALKEVGISAFVKQVPWDEYVALLESGNFDMFIGGFDLSASLDYMFMLGTNGYGNYMGYSSASMDNAILDLYSKSTDEEIKSAYREFQYIFTRDVPVAGLCFENELLIYNNKVKGIKTPSFSNVYRDINEWFITE